MSTRAKKILYVCIAAAAVIAITMGLMSCGGKNGVLSEIVITPSTPSVASGYSLQLGAQGVLSDGVTYYMTSLTWTSLEPGIATVDSKGLVTAVSGTTGIVTITATENDSHKNITGSVQLEVASIQSIAVTPVNPGMAVGTAYQFHATATLSNGATQDLTSSPTYSLTSLNWTSQYPDVATVLTPTPGVVFGGLVTTTTVTGQMYPTAIKATDLITGVFGSTPLTVTDTPLASIAVSIASDPTVTTVTTGSSPQLVATATYGDLTTLDRTTSMTWSSSDTALATMSTITTGCLVTYGTTTGTVTITATDPITGKAGSLALTIN